MCSIASGEPGIQREWWYHSASSTWFIAERDTASDEIVRTYLWGEEDTSVKRRLSAQPGEWIDRTYSRIEFRFEGEVFSGFAGDVIASALLGQWRPDDGEELQVPPAARGVQLGRARRQCAVYRRRAHASARR